MLEFKVKVGNWLLITLDDLIGFIFYDDRSYFLSLLSAESHSVHSRQHHLQEYIVFVVLLDEIVITGTCTFIN